MCLQQLTEHIQRASILKQKNNNNKWPAHTELIVHSQKLSSCGAWQIYISNKSIVQNPIKPIITLKEPDSKQEQAPGVSHFFRTSSSRLSLSYKGSPTVKCVSTSTPCSSEIQCEKQHVFHWAALVWRLLQTEHKSKVEGEVMRRNGIDRKRKDKLLDTKRAFSPLAVGRGAGSGW